MATLSMDDKLKDRPSRAAKRAAINLIDTSSTKKRSASTQEHSSRVQKARKTTPSAPSARVDKGAGDVSTQFHKTPATKRQASYTSLIEHETIYASDMQKQIAAEARGVSRKNIPWDKFCSIYLCDLKLFYSGTQGKEVSSKPGFVLHVGEEPPVWADVELIFEYTQSRG